MGATGACDRGGNGWGWRRLTTGRAEGELDEAGVTRCGRTNEEGGDGGGYARPRLELVP